MNHDSKLFWFLTAAFILILTGVACAVKVDAQDLSEELQLLPRCGVEDYMLLVIPSENVALVYVWVNEELQSSNLISAAYTDTVTIQVYGLDGSSTSFYYYPDLCDATPTIFGGTESEVPNETPQASRLERFVEQLPSQIQELYEILQD